MTPNELLAGVLPWVRLLARRAARRLRVDADDVAQSLALAVLAAAPRYDPDKGRFTSFAAAVCRRAVARLIEQQARDVRAGGWPVGADGGELLPADPRQLDPAEAVADAEAWKLRRQRLYSALARLTPLERAAVRARYGFGGREPAKTLAGIDPTRTANASGETLRRAMGKLEGSLRREPQLARRLKKLRRHRERRDTARGLTKPAAMLGLGSEGPA